MSTQILSAIATQVAALRRISRAAGYDTDLGLAVIYPGQPAEQNSAPQIYRGTIGFDSAQRADLLRLTLTWEALVVGDPATIDEAAITAQSDMMRALLGACPTPTLVRRDIPTRDPRSYSLIVAVTATLPLQEVSPP